MPPCTTKRTTTNLKTNNNQNSQKIELYGSPTTKEINKKHPSRLVEGEGMGSQAERIEGSGGLEDRAGKRAAGGPSQAADCGLGSPTFTCR